MKRIAIAFAAVAAALCCNISPSHALTGNAPWCAVVNVGTGEVVWQCDYQTVEQCQPNVIAGNRGFCNHNPYYTAPAAMPNVRHHPRRHVHHPA